MSTSTNSNFVARAWKYLAVIALFICVGIFPFTYPSSASNTKIELAGTNGEWSIYCAVKKVKKGMQNCSITQSMAAKPNPDIWLKVGVEIRDYPASGANLILHWPTKGILEDGISLDIDGDQIGLIFPIDCENGICHSKTKISPFVLYKIIKGKVAHFSLRISKDQALALPANLVQLNGAIGKMAQIVLGRGNLSEPGSLGTGAYSWVSKLGKHRNISHDTGARPSAFGRRNLGVYVELKSKVDKNPTIRVGRTCHISPKKQLVYIDKDLNLNVDDQSALFELLKPYNECQDNVVIYVHNELAKPSPSNSGAYARRSQSLDIGDLIQRAAVVFELTSNGVSKQSIKMPDYFGEMEFSIE